MTLSAAFSAGAAMAMLFVAFVVGALLVIATVTVPVVAVMAAVFWAHQKLCVRHQKEANEYAEQINHIEEVVPLYVLGSKI
jgi:hypothetical protein